MFSNYANTSGDLSFKPTYQVLSPHYLYGGSAREYWDTIHQDEQVKRYFATLPSREIGESVKSCTRAVGVSVVWLGVGSSHLERMVTETLRSQINVTKIVVHEHQASLAEIEANKFRQQMPTIPVEILSGDFRNLDLSKIHVADEKTLLCSVGASMSNLPDLDVLLPNLTKQLRPGDFLFSDFTVANRKAEHRIPKDGSITGNASAVLSPIELKWIYIALQNYCIDQGKPCKAKDIQLTYSVRSLAKDGYAVEISAAFSSSLEPISVLHFVRFDEQVLDTFISKLGLRLLVSRETHPLIRFKLAEMNGGASDFYATPLPKH
jgi:hypothetical protein